ncbi:Rpn family recombination-promoting nuclease/putative transposase [Laspinema palackyanum]|uniref:Rpn family recombination-promoting nuclease/putative transposase n=1 Tax=Laspinema palackyanum TaxID=3231601 RepID=UPI00345DD281|nr:Rpn family recombination-promoting nuclease/putative transposase [Laspinema sp. D2c]
MRFINPKTDIAFKKIFGSEQSKDILISFLNAMLYEGQPIIEDLEILNPYLAPRIRGVKETYLDIKAKITGNKTAIVEMQVLNVAGFEKRILYNAAKSYSIQLDVGEDYNLLNPVIALTIVDFQMFADFDKVISHFVLKEKDYLVDYLSYDLELVFVELPKFTKELEQLETLTDKWLYFMKSGRNLQTVPETMSAVPEIEQAFEIANQANLNREELEELEQREIFIHDQRNAILKAVNNREREIAKGLLNLLDEEAIAQTTGLSLEEVQKLKQQ